MTKEKFLQAIESYKLTEQPVIKSAEDRAASACLKIAQQGIVDKLDEMKINVGHLTKDGIDKYFELEIKKIKALMK